VAEISPEVTNFPAGKDCSREHRAASAQGFADARLRICGMAPRPCRARLHVEVKDFFYSMSHMLIRAEVDAARHYAHRRDLTSRPANCRPSARYGGCRRGSDPDHIPSSHRRYAERASDRFRRWAQTIVPNTEALISPSSRIGRIPSRLSNLSRAFCGSIAVLRRGARRSTLAPRARDRR
jgi:hypothetical protein